MALSAIINIFIRYVVVGAGNTILCVTLMYIGAISGLHYLVYTALGYITSIFFSFFMNLYFTFKVKGQIITRLGKFVIYNMLNLCLVEVIEYILIESFAMQQFFAVLCGMSWYMITGFFINRYIVYGLRND